MAKKAPDLIKYAEALLLIENAEKSLPELLGNELTRALLDQEAIKIAFEMAHAVIPDAEKKRMLARKKDNPFTKTVKPVPESLAGT